MNNNLKLGDKIKFQKSVYTAFKYIDEPYKELCEEHHKEIIEGIVAGKRNIQEGFREYDEGVVWFNCKKRHKVYIVYFHMSRKPVFVREEDIIIN